MRIAVLTALVLVACTQPSAPIVPPVTVALAAPKVSTPRFDYPVARRGSEVNDPYRWLENDDDPEVAAWFAAEDARARREIAKLDGTKELIEEMTKLYAHPLKRMPTKRGTREFSQNGATIKEGERELFTAKDISSWTLSPDGSLLFVELSTRGADMRSARLIDTKTSAELDTLQGLEDSRVVWHERGLFYAYTAPEIPHADRWANREIRYHAIGTPQAKDRVVVPASHDKDASSAMNPLARTKDGKRLVVCIFGNWGRATYGVVDLTKSDWPVQPLPPAVDSTVVVENAVFAFLKRPDGSGDIARIGGAAPEILASMPSQFLDIEAKGKTLIVTRAAKPGEESNGFLHRDFYDASFHPLGTYTTKRGVFDYFSAYPDSETMTVTRQGLGIPEHRLHLEAKTGKWEDFVASEVPWDKDAFATDTLTAKSKDGTAIPITVLHRKDLPLDGRAKLAVYGYGGFRNSAEQLFFPPWMVWANASDRAFATCHIRGGLEFGEAWHEAGARRNRQKTIDDFHACIEELHRRGYGAPETTVTQGWSHGGMMVTAAAVQRPDLQRVVLSLAPLADMIRFPIYGRGGVSEYGDPDDAGDLAALAAFSPIHNMKDGARYPAFFITQPSKDERVHPMHGRKLAATLQHASTGGEVLLKVLWDAGHHGGGKDDANATIVEGWSFALSQMKKGHSDESK